MSSEHIKSEEKKKRLLWTITATVTCNHKNNFYWSDKFQETPRDLRILQAL